MCTNIPETKYVLLQDGGRKKTLLDFRNDLEEGFYTAVMHLICVLRFPNLSAH